MTGCNTISAQRAGQSGLAFYNIRPVQCIVFTVPGAGHTIGATAVVDMQPEGIDKAGQVYKGADGAIGSAMNHPALSPGDQ